MLFRTLNKYFLSMNGLRWLCALATCCSAMFIDINAQPGSLDMTFGTGGKVIDGISHTFDGANDVAVQPDGKIVAVGRGSSAFALVRYQPDGSLDTSFGQNGKVATADFGGGEALSVALQSDGKIVAAGYTGIARYNSDGSLDPSFGSAGKVTPPIIGHYSFGISLAIQPDGKIVAGGALSDGSTEDFAVVRCNSDGSLDTSFDGDGIAVIAIGAGDSYVSSIAIEPDGKVAAGGFLAGEQFRPAIARFNANGSLDNSFGTGGIVIVALGYYLADLAVQSDGKLFAICPGNGQFALLRLNENGSLDPAFGNGNGYVLAEGNSSHLLIQPDGKIIVKAGLLRRFNANGEYDVSFGMNGIGGYGYNSVALQADGRIVVAGAVNFGLDADFGIARYTTDGAVDNTFGSDGRVETDFGRFADNLLYSVVAQADGRIVAVGTSGGSYAIARYNSDGSPDASFGNGSGKVVVPFNGDYLQFYHISSAVAPDGKILFAATGYTYGFGYYVLELIRLNPDGSADDTFNNGMLSDYGANDFSSSNSVIVRADNKIIADAGRLLWRLDPDGSPDPAFGGGDGVADLPIIANKTVVQPDGKIVSVGANAGQFAVARCNPDGSLDQTFGKGGFVTTGDGSAASVVLQPDGKIVVGGTQLVRYHSDGSLDTGFGVGGKSALPFYSTELALQSDGKIAAAGTLTGDFALLRFNTNGSPDISFGGGNGIAIIDFNNSSDHANALALDGQGRAVVVGDSDGAFALARFLMEPRRTAFDFDGDGRSDVSIFRPFQGEWYLNRSTEGFTAVQFGISRDKIVPGDYDGDGKTDIAMYRDGVWWRINSSDSTVSAVQFGLASDVPVPADYTGDDRDDLAVFRNGEWWSMDLANGQVAAISFGLAGDRPVPADYDGDGHIDQAVYRDGVWHLNRSALGYTAMQFGISTDKLVAGDYDGDAKADLAVYRDGSWYLLQSTAGFTALQFGLPTDIPVPADYDGDGKADISVFRDGLWYRMNSSNGNFITLPFGLAADRPVPNAFRF